MFRKTMKQIFSTFLAICMMLTVLSGVTLALYDEEATTAPCCLDCVRDGYTIDDIRQILNDGEQIYPDIHASDEDGELEDFTDIEYGEVQPFHGEEIDFRYYRIRGEGRSVEDSIVVMLLGDGFAQGQFGTWDALDPDPDEGSALWHANEVIDRMLSLHPFYLFEDYFIVYMIHYAPYDQEPGRNGYFGTVTAAGGVAPRASTRWSEINRVSLDVVPVPSHRNMVQVISNSNGGSGFAQISLIGAYDRHFGIAVTSIDRPANQQTSLHNSWHRTFLHEVGHAFGALLDEFSGVNLYNLNGEIRANAARLSDAELKWQHWVESSRDVSNVSHDGIWVVPAGGSCIMGYGNMRFCGVCAAELIRRMAYITREPFHGRSPASRLIYLPNSPNYPWTHTSHIDLGEHRQEVTRILDSAFHGNRGLQSVRIPASVETIGNYAFIGATGLRAIVHDSVIPQQVNSTTFAGVTRENVNVFIPAGTRQAYVDAGWTDFILIEDDLPISITFNFYGRPDAPVVLPVQLRQELCSVTIADITMQVAGDGSDNNGGYAFWGWFPGDQLDGSGRVRNGYRRPTVGDVGLDLTSETLGGLLVGPFVDADSGRAELYGIWSLWGDVDDSGRVDIDDIDSMRRNILGLVPRLPMNRAPGDVYRDGVLDIDDIDTLRRNVVGLIPRPVMGQ
ncbi:MAG: hypothetical protein FWD05_13790, partial [Oscillospiraceae bacterium]|nr:hypothetical protein [Oscillospiraceae bacterium]